MFVIVFLFFLATFREDPPIPPTPVASAPIKLLNVCDSFKLMKNNANYGLLVLAFAINQAALNSIGVLKSDIFSAFEWTPEHITILSITFVGAGIFGAALFSFLLDRTRAFKTII